MSALSDQVVSIATLVYLLAMISHAVEYALGNSRVKVTAPPARELVGAAVGGGAG
ncbi:c-type cytochrome biogenesis protein CcsB, partial [Verrucosispora sp. SN26_14.1]